MSKLFLLLGATALLWTVPSPADAFLVGKGLQNPRGSWNLRSDERSPGKRDGQSNGAPGSCCGDTPSNAASRGNNGRDY